MYVLTLTGIIYLTPLKQYINLCNDACVVLEFEEHC